jgi:starvation-inducible outer membrane lipoprotein
MHSNRYLVIVIFTFCLAACSTSPPAPVIDRLPSGKTTKASKAKSQLKTVLNRVEYKAGDWRPDSYTVKKSDTLFSIGLEFGYDYKEIAQANGHQEWQAEIQSTFAGRWIDKAQAGWWVQGAGGWVKK